MIKEFAFSLSKRHYFQDANEMQNWMNIDSDTFMSLYDYPEYVKTFFAKKKSLSGYDGDIYMPDEFILDVDGPEFDKAHEKTCHLLGLLEDLMVPFLVYVSGTGFHVHIPKQSFRWKPSKDLHIKVKQVLTDFDIFKYADPAVTDKTRIIRVPNTRNSKSGLYKVALPKFPMDVTDIIEYAKSPKKIPILSWEDKGIIPVFDANVEIETQETIINNNKIVISDEGRMPDPINYPCISSMYNDTPLGSRHMVALRLASWFRWLYPENLVKIVMENWRQKVNTDGKFTEKEMTQLIEGCYSGHGGNGYRYGCNDSIMDDYCKNTCRLYKSKKSQMLLDSTAMEDALIDFVKSDINPMNLGSIYGQDFPVYPGEVVIIQAPPKSMKTMILQNWVNHFKKPTLFLEMEMSPRQMWTRFVMIENKWSDDQLKKHYLAKQNGMNKKFEWLMMDFSTPYPYELEKKISTMAFKPEVVVVDHMGLFRSKQRDNNMKIEEASQALMELAVKHNLIVFSVSEITKQAFHEGMNIASTKGSFRTAYNANKLISVNPFKSNNTNLIEYLHVKCEANREREYLDVKLKVTDANIDLYSGE